VVSGWNDSSQLTQFDELGTVECLGEKVCDHVFSWAVVQSNLVGPDLLSDEVCLDIQVLSPGVKDGVLG